MVSKELITFSRKDKLPKHIEITALLVADHFKRRRNYISQFCRLIKVSKRWKIQKIDEELVRWKDSFSKIEGTRNIIDIICNGFPKCSSNEEIHKLRGALVEALLIGCFGGSEILNQNNYGWGAQVQLNKQLEPQKLLKYHCNKSDNHDCHNRTTVDFGYWDGYHAKFFECKAQPIGIGCKEVSYMKYLKNEMASERVSNEVFFVCPEHRDSIIMRLEEYGLSPVYKAWGTKELNMNLPA
ncbi:hypothetical protein P4U90_20680 [Cytobacillus kochii]|uniref:hypothetical protein n=1 Tax=Cytobacillus kochii TaxID=859143 RepID=UPI002E1A63C5|nr:hypothetical protein [Cytobacillus kochii]